MALSKHFGLTMGSMLALGALYFAACDSEPEELLTERSVQGNVIDKAGSLEFAFELDGDAMADAKQGTDWSEVFDNIDGNDIAPIKLKIDDPGTTTVFTGGGSKDGQAIANWRWTTASVPDKDNITHAFATAYFTDELTPELVVFFGADRYANDGDAQMGFWFFQKNVKTEPDGTFSGSHVNGDLLILANFSNGGAQATIEVYEWMNGKLQKKLGTDVECIINPTDPEDPNLPLLCAIANVAEATAPWPYTSKSGSNKFPANTFFEGGMNLTKLYASLGQNLPCFASFMAETRTSTTANSTLKDFALGSFPVCGLGITEQCSESTVNEDATGYEHGVAGTVINSGAGTIFNVVIMLIAEGMSPVEIVVPAPLAPGQTYNYTHEFYSTLPDLSVAASVKAATADNGPLDLSSSVSPSPTCHATVFHPAVSVTNACEAKLADMDNDDKLEFVVQHTRKICNTTPTPDGENPLPMTIQVLDVDKDVIIGEYDLMAPDCFDLPYTYDYPTDPNVLEYPGSTVKATGHSNLFGQATAQAFSGSCGLCPSL
jgi:hypothetical protein